MRETFLKVCNFSLLCLALDTKRPFHGEKVVGQLSLSQSTSQKILYRFSNVFTDTQLAFTFWYGY